MVRRIALLCLPLSALAIWGALACGGTKNFTFDAGFIDAGVDAGPCDVYAQTACPADLKCTIMPDGGTLCGSKGTGDDYVACTDDSDCKAGTACVDLEFSGFVAGKHCFPFCDLSLQPTDGGTTCPQATSGSSCLNLTTIPEGFCDLPLDAGP